ncbi:MAG: 2-hydroxyacyl-CoA dehydratase [bacterium]|nr:2-hydroxyacyl-CoA dehydratase [bacterium]
MKKIAYFDSSHDMPEEIIMAAGFIPYKILGNVHESNGPADQYLPNFFCPAAKSWLTEALSHSAEWAGIIFAHGCDATNRHYDIWKLHVETPFLYWFNSPTNDDSLAAKFFIAELKRLITGLEQQFNISISAEKLKEAIKKSNEIKKRMRELSALRAERDISNYDYFTIIKKSLQENKEDLIREFDEKINEWNKRPSFPVEKKRFLLTGSDVTYGEWMKTLDECDIRVIRDDLSTGERYFAGLISEEKDPLEALAEYYLTIPKPATKVSLQKRIDYLITCLGETGVDAILSQNLKFCEAYAYDSVTVNNTLTEKGFKLIHLERELSPVPDQQMTNRLMAFTEIL